MIYFAKIRKQKGGNWLVEFPDLSGCMTEGSTLEKALSSAREALNGWLASNCDRNLDIPNPVLRKGRSYHPIEVDLPISFAIRLRRLRARKGLTQLQAAKKLGVTQQAYARLESPTRTNPSLTTLQKIADSLDVEIDVRLVS